MSHGQSHFDYRLASSRNLEPPPPLPLYEAPQPGVDVRMDPRAYNDHEGGVFWDPVQPWDPYSVAAPHTAQSHTPSPPHTASSNASTSTIPSLDDPPYQLSSQSSSLNNPYGRIPAKLTSSPYQRAQELDGSTGVHRRASSEVAGARPAPYRVNSQRSTLNPTSSSSLRGFRTPMEPPVQAAPDPRFAFYPPPDHRPHDQYYAPESTSSAPSTAQSAYSSTSFDTVPSWRWKRDFAAEEEDRTIASSSSSSQDHLHTRPVTSEAIPRPEFHADHQWGNQLAIPFPDLYHRSLPRAPTNLATTYSTNPPSPPPSTYALPPSPPHSYTHHPLPPRLSASPTSTSTAIPPPRPCDADFNTIDELIPKPSELRFVNDKYRPAWVRGTGHTKQGWCSMCPDDKSWFQLRTSAYWYHVQFTHGVSAATGQLFPEPIETRAAETGDRAEGLCPVCQKWTLYRSHMSGATLPPNAAAWYRHVYSCLKNSHKPGNAAVADEGNTSG